VVSGPEPNTSPSLGQQQELALRVTEVRLEADDVVSITFADPEGGDLPEWTPGAHIELQLPSGLQRQYSLCGATGDRKRYTIAVLRENDGRGGSVELHDSALVGRVLRIRAVRNHFKLQPSEKYLFIAGGIGVTPILAMAREIGGSAPWTMHYGGRSHRSMAFLDELACSEGQVHVTPQDEQGILDLESILRSADIDTAIYCCGPAGLLDAARSEHKRLAPASPFFFERFEAAEPSTSPSEAAGLVADEEFELELRRSGVTTVVPKDKTVLEVIREFVPDAPSSCEEGYCGSCECAVLEGTPDHRDDILTPQEKQENRTMFPCISRAHGKLVLDC
jgi:ferredoxin-NADP reductase